MGQEPEQGSGERGAGDRQPGLSRQARHQAHQQGDQRPERRCQAVHPVDEVVGVGDADDPEHRQEHVARHAHGAWEQVQPHPGGDHHERARELESETQPRRQPAGVVQSAGQHQGEGGGGDGQHLPVDGGSPAKSEDEGGEHRHAPQFGRRRVVPLARIGVIDGAAAQGDQAHERRQPEGGQERHERDLGDAAGGRSGQEPEPHGEEGYDRHRRTSPVTRSASSSVSAG